MNKKLKLIAISLVSLSVIGSAFGIIGETMKHSFVEADTDYVNFLYVVNYEGGSNRIDRVQKGSRAVNWQAKHRGYRIEAWYLDLEFSKEYDFSIGVKEDTVVYAKWIEGGSEDEITVTFDYNYKGSPQPYVYHTRSGQKIAVDNVPVPSRFGYDATGWYLDPDDPSTKWSFLNDEFFESTTLYAGYREDSSLVRDEKGYVIFDDITIDFAPNVMSWGGGGAEVDAIVNEFNNTFAGKINVQIVPYDTTEVVTLEDTGFINQNKGDYYNIGEVLESIKHPFDTSDYYPDAISENFIAGTLTSYPVAHLVPMMVYNKKLLNDMEVAKFPTSHNDIYNLLVDANKHFGGLQDWNGALSISEYDWATYEIGSHIMWSNSNFRYMDYDSQNHKYINNFKVYENKERLLNAYTGYNRIFGYNSDINSGYSENYLSSFILGNSLACYLGFSTEFQNLRNRLGINDKAFIQRYGVCPVNDLCNYNDYENSHVFAKGISIGVRNTAYDLNEVAAAAVFAEYFSKHSEPLMNKYAYPASISVQEGEDFNQGDFESYILKSAVKPERVWTLPGHKMNYKMFNYYNQNCLSAVMTPREITKDGAERLTLSFGNAFQSLMEEE